MFVMVSIYAMKILVNKGVDFCDMGLVDLLETTSIPTRICLSEIKYLALVGPHYGVCWDYLVSEVVLDMIPFFTYHVILRDFQLDHIHFL